MQGESGKKHSDIVLQYLTKQERKLGISGLPYTREKEHYEEAMNQTFKGLMVSTIALLCYNSDSSQYFIHHCVVLSIILY